jgi:hypothetical protein
VGFCSYGVPGGCGYVAYGELPGDTVGKGKPGEEPALGVMNH